jgi:hypothetical protein
MNTLIERVKNILIAPQKEWDVIKQEETTIMDMFKGYAALLAAIPAVMIMVAMILWGGIVEGILFFDFKFFMWTIIMAIFHGVLTYILSLGGAYVLGMLTDLLAESFGAQKDQVQSMKVSVYSYTATWVAGVLHIIPVAGSILAGLAGIYSLVLLYMGLEKVKEPPKDKTVIYFIVLLVIMFIIFGIIAGLMAVFTILINLIFFGVGEYAVPTLS